MAKNGLKKIKELKELFKLSSNKKIFLKLVDLMCKSNTTPKDIEEEELLHQRKEVEMVFS